MLRDNIFGIYEENHGVGGSNRCLGSGRLLSSGLGRLVGVKFELFPNLGFYERGKVDFGKLTIPIS